MGERPGLDIELMDCRGPLGHAGPACREVEVGDAFVHLEEFAPLSLVVGRLVNLSRSCLEQATMIVQFDARHI